MPATILFDKRSVRTRQEADQLKLQVTQLEAQRDAQLKTHEEQVRELDTIKLELEKNFNVLADSALTRNTQSFLRLAQENFDKHKMVTDKDQESRQQSLKQLVTPLNENLTKIEETVRTIEKERGQAYTSMQEQIKFVKESNQNLKLETNRLVQALRQPKARGRWGEIQLRNVLELVGMTEHIDYEQEQTFNTEDGRKRPDVVVRLPGERYIVIDAKTPLDAYLSSIEADNESEQANFGKSHARQLRNQVKKLAAAEYQNNVPDTTDFVVMFVPGESLYSVALEHDPELFEFALRHQVMIATPMSLVLLLKVIVLGWQHEKLSANAKEIVRTGQELHERLSKFAERVSDHGRSLRKVVDTYNSAVGSMENRLMPSARRLESLEVAPRHKKTETPSTIEVTPRKLRDSGTNKVSSPEIQSESN